jgi:hypothetical protein
MDISLRSQPRPRALVRHQDKQLDRVRRVPWDIRSAGRQQKDKLKQETVRFFNRETSPEEERGRMTLALFF